MSDLCSSSGTQRKTSGHTTCKYCTLPTTVPVFIASISSGNARVTAFASTGTARTYNYQVRMVSCSPCQILTSRSRAVTSATSLLRTVRSAYSPSTTSYELTFPRQGHYIENIGDTDLHFLEIFDSGMSL